MSRYVKRGGYAVASLLYRVQAPGSYRWYAWSTE